MMNPHRKQKWACVLLGVVVGSAVTLALECCCSAPTPSPVFPTVCADAGAPVVVPACDDAGGPPDAAPAPTPLAFDAGPSCGTHPWANSPRCCTADCNRS